MYFINPILFLDNVKSWVRELPIKRILFGIGSKNIDVELFKEGLKDIIPESIPYECVDQTTIKTLGMCIADLIKRVETEWFVYLHTDVFLTEHCWILMKSFTNNSIGIIESERYHWDGSYIDLDKKQPKYTNESYFSRPRAFSGFQLIQKNAVKEIVEKIEDDYIYRNEDLIFQNAIKNAGFEYKKVLAIHIHQITNNNNWSTKREEAYCMQWKGLIKYAIPDLICLDACVQAFRVNLKENGYSPALFLDYAKRTNIKWYWELLNYCIIKVIEKVQF